MEMLEKANELAIFKSKAVIPFVKFKWEKFGMRHHFWGLAVHFIQVLILIIYVDSIYIRNTLKDCWHPKENGEKGECSNRWALTLLIGVCHTAIYELIQMWR
jgi:hypothetical protein